MIKNLIFDFGDVFINLDKTATARELQKLGGTTFSKSMMQQNIAYEKGLLSTEDFLNFYQQEFIQATPQQLTSAWNAVLLDFPPNRLSFIQDLAHTQEYRLFLLSNTNALHIQYLREKLSFFDHFKKCFEQFYLSHEIYMRKPDSSIYTFVLQENQLNPEETLFIDDTKENILAAQKMGFHTWHLHPKIDEVTDLFSAKRALFF